MIKTLRILIFILFSSFLVSSQENEIESDFLNEVIFSDQDSIIYVEKSFGWNKIKKVLNRKVFIDYNQNNTNTIELIDKEFEFILNEIKINRNHIWDTNLFPKAIKISHDKVESFLHNVNRPAKLELENYQKSIDTSAAINLKNKLYFAKTFTKPIFFRKNQFCIFYHKIITGDNNDYEQIAFYKKVNGKWIEWLEIFNNLN